jgi:hypothetical protein
MTEVAAHIENADPLLGKYEGPRWVGPSELLEPGLPIEHDGKAGTIIHVDHMSYDGAPVVLVNWVKSSQDTPENT